MRVRPRQTARQATRRRGGTEVRLLPLAFPPLALAIPRSLSGCFACAGEIADLVYKEVQFIFMEEDGLHEIELTELVDGLNEKTPIIQAGKQIVAKQGFTTATVKMVLLELSEQRKLTLFADGTIMML